MRNELPVLKQPVPISLKLVPTEIPVDIAVTGFPGAIEQMRDYERGRSGLRVTIADIPADALVEWCDDFKGRLLAEHKRLNEMKALTKP